MLAAVLLSQHRFARRDQGSQQDDGGRPARCVELRRGRRRLHGARRLHARVRRVRSDGAVAARSRRPTRARPTRSNEGRPRRRAGLHARARPKAPRRTIRNHKPGTTRRSATCWCSLAACRAARIEFERADATFPGHPMAVAGLARIRMMDGDLHGRAPDAAVAARPHGHARSGDRRWRSLARRSARTTTADQYYQMAEQIERAAWGNGLRQPQALARILSERPGRTAEAVGLAEEAARTRTDIVTMDTLAWAYFRNGQLADARQGVRAGAAHRHAQRAHSMSRANVRSPLAAAISSSRAPGAIRHCLEWRP